MQVISVKCAICSHAMKFAGDKAGRKAKCPKCKNILTVPQPATAEAGSAAANGPGAPPATEEEGSYGVVVDKELEERRRQIEEADRLRQKELKKKKKPKIEKKFKSLPDAEQWEKVHFGLIFLFLGTCVWALAQLLQVMWVALGSVEYNDYAHLVTELIERQDPMIPEHGQFWGFSQYHFLVSLAAGRAFVGFAKVCLAINLLLYPIQWILWVVGYILCLPVPKHYGTLGQLIFLFVLAFFNAMFFLFFRLIPTTGLYRYYVIPYFIPEVMFTQYNMERVYPIFMLWSGSAFWDSLLAMFLQFVYYLQPVVGCAFIWSCGSILKANRLEEQANGVAATGLATYFIWLSYLMIALCGTTPVLVATLRVLYILWISSLLMFIVRYALLIWSCRETLATRLNPEG